MSDTQPQVEVDDHTMFIVQRSTLSIMSLSFPEANQLQADLRGLLAAIGVAVAGGNVRLACWPGERLKQPTSVRVLAGVHDGQLLVIREKPLNIMAFSRTEANELQARIRQQLLKDSVTVIEAL